MTTQEFRSEFDTLYNNIRSNTAPGLDGYEISVLLTISQEEIVMNHFDPRSVGNTIQVGFDQSEKRDIEFAKLLRVEDITGSQPSISYSGIDERSEFFIYPENSLLILNEQIFTDRKCTVVPLNYREYDRLMSKPYHEPEKRQAWRLLQTSVEDNRIISEIIVKTGTTVNKYVVRYVKRPNPIIVEDLTSFDLTINGLSEVTECELDSIVHRDILKRAVERAKQAYENGSLESLVQLNQRSE